MKKNLASVAIIGSGVAGLSAAIRLALQGKQVIVFEQNPYTGGKVTAFEKQGFRFDMGPSLFTMPHLVEELFELAGRTPKDYFQYHTNDEVCRYFWLDGKHITLYPSVEKTWKPLPPFLAKSLENESESILMMRARNSSSRRLSF